MIGAARADPGIFVAAASEDHAEHPNLPTGRVSMLLSRRELHGVRLSVAVQRGNTAFVSNIIAAGMDTVQ